MTDKLRETERQAVKPLVWYDCADGTSHDEDCLYEIELDGKYWRLIRATTGGGSYVGHHGSREAAKAAADKHHADRVNDWISAALAAAPQPASRDSTRSENQLWADVYGDAAPQSIPVDREALVEVIGGALAETYERWDIGDPAEHIADALLARGLRLPGGEETREASDEVKAYLDGVIGVVEANSFESMCLWQANRESRKWVSSGHGYGSCVGNCAGKPVCISLTTAMVDGHKILFIEATSEIVDWVLIEAWLKKNLPSTAWTDGRINRTNAMNFHNIIPRVAIRVVEDSDDAS